MEENTLKCGICGENYIDPQQLPCLHSFCKACIDRLDRNSHEQINCRRCEQLHGASERQRDNLIQSLADFLDGDREVACEKHDNNCEVFCNTCERVICGSCERQKHNACSVTPITPDNIRELFSEMCSTIYQDVEDYNLTAIDIKRKVASEQQTLYRQKAETSTKVSSFFYNLKHKLIEHLMRQEQMLQEELNTYFEKKEDQICKKINQCRSVKERLEYESEAFKILEKNEASMLHFGILGLMRSDLAKCKSKMPISENGSIRFCPDENKVYEMFDIKPCNIKFYDEQDEEVVIEERPTETPPTYTIDDFLSYRPTSNRVPRDPESANSQNLDQNEPPVSHDEGADIDIQDDTARIDQNDNGTSDLPTYESVSNTPRTRIAPSAPPSTTAEIDDSNADSHNAFPVDYTDNNLTNQINQDPTPIQGQAGAIGIEDPLNYFQYGDYVTGFKSRLAEDVKSSSPVGMTWIGGDRILMVDRFNRKLKLITEDGDPISVVTVQEGEPWDIVHTSQKGDDTHFCAVCVPTAKLLLYVRVIEKIVIIRKIRTWFGYCSLGHDKIGHALICGVCPPFGSPGVHVVNAEGAILKEFVVDSVGRPLFEYPRSIDVTKDGELIICDWKMKRLVFMKTDGFIIGEYRGSVEHPLKEPIGTTLDGLGNILVTDTGTHTLQIISMKDRQFVSYLTLNREISSPREVHITSPGNYPKIAVVTFNSIAIFDLWSSDSSTETAYPLPSNSSVETDYPLPPSDSTTETTYPLPSAPPATTL